MARALTKDGTDVFNVISDRLMSVLPPVQAMLPHIAQLPAGKEFQVFVDALNHAAKAYEDYLSADWRATVLAATDPNVATAQ